MRRCSPSWTHSERRHSKSAHRSGLNEPPYQPPADSVDLYAAPALFSKLGALKRKVSDKDSRDIARALFDAVWVDLDGKRVVAIQMKKTLRPLRNVLSMHTEAHQESSGASSATTIAECGPDGIRTRDLQRDRLAC